MTDEMKKRRDELSEAFVAEMVTMNNRPPHRPDVLKWAHESGFNAAAELYEAREKILVDALRDCESEFGLIGGLTSCPRTTDQINKEDGIVDRLRAALDKVGSQ